MGYAFGIKQHTSFSLRNQPFTVPLPSIGRVCLEKSVRVSSTPNLAVLKNPDWNIFADANCRIRSARFRREKAAAQPHPAGAKGVTTGAAVLAFPQASSRSLPHPVFLRHEWGTRRGLENRTDRFAIPRRTNTSQDPLARRLSSYDGRAPTEILMRTFSVSTKGQR